MRKQPIVTGEYYHIYNRGVDKRDIFNDKEDLHRFIESICEFNQIDGIGSIRDLRKSKSESKALHLPISKDPLVAIVAYCLNPNHFHFILKQLVDGGIAKFMQKLQGGYTYYFNVKNFNFISKIEGNRILEIFNGNKDFKKHCDEIVEIIRQERGKTSLLEEDNLPDRV